MHCVASGKLLSPMYLMCDAVAYILIYCGSTKISFSNLFSCFHTINMKIIKIYSLLKDKWV